MTAIGWAQIALFFVVVFALVKPMGEFMFRVFELKPPLPRLERFFLRLCGTDGAEQTWMQYTFALLAFSALGLVVTFAIQRLQGVLPFNPQHLGAVEPALAFNTAVSFVTNTNWQAYTPETTVSYL